MNLKIVGEVKLESYPEAETSDTSTPLANAIKLVMSVPTSV